MYGRYDNSYNHEYLDISMYDGGTPQICFFSKGGAYAQWYFAKTTFLGPVEFLDGVSGVTATFG